MVDLLWALTTDWNALRETAVCRSAAEAAAAPWCGCEVLKACGALRAAVALICWMMLRLVFCDLSLATGACTRRRLVLFRVAAVVG